MKLKEVTLTSKADAYSVEFFEEVSKQPVGKVFEFEHAIPETTLRSKAHTFGAKLGVKFTVVSTGENKFAVGITDKVRKPRVKKAVPSVTLEPEPSLEPAVAVPDLEAVEAIVDAEGV